MITKFEKYKINENSNPIIYDIKMLSKLISDSIGGDKDIYNILLSRSFKSNGDDGVIDMFYDMTNLRLEPMIKGRYRIIGF
jgi:hypothetical protein